MCFLHALATRHARGDDDGKDTLLPFVTCFEQAAEAGGCWRSVSTEERSKAHNQACWYDNVWSNVCKECFEFHDYPYQEHFEGEVPTFLPRHELLNYFTKRIQSVDPNLLDGTAEHALHEIRYSTSVTSVSFDDKTQLFTVTTSPYGDDDDNHNATARTSEQFEYCIWAAGIRGKPRIPRALLTLFKSGQSMIDRNSLADTPFCGTILHATHASKLPDAVLGKRVVLVGDSDSAVDLALYAVKCGAHHVDVLSRSGYGDCFYMGSWPKGDEDAPKVKVHVAIPIRVVEEGRSIQCARVSWNPEEEMYQMESDAEPFVLPNVDTVVFCTGYVPNTSFLPEGLKIHSEDLFSWCWSAPPDFVMRDNPLTPDLGDITPSADLGFSGNLFPGVYRTVLQSNPKMMYIMDINSEYPLLHLEAEAWLCLAFCAGNVTMPPNEDVEQEIQSKMLEEMNVAYLRWSIDPNYFDAMFDLGDSHWTDDYNDERTIQMNQEYLGYYIGLIARNLRDAKYPVKLSDESGTLTELGRKLVDLGLLNVKMRHLLDSDAPDATWRTFRDTPEILHSIYTGQPSAPLPRPWLELTPEDDVVGREKEANENKRS